MHGIDAKGFATDLTNHLSLPSPDTISGTWAIVGCIIFGTFFVCLLIRWIAPIDQQNYAASSSARTDVGISTDSMEVAR